MRKVIIHWHDSEHAVDEEEEYVEGERASFRIGEPEPEAWARDLLKRFNDTLRPGERERIVDSVDVVEFGGTPKIAHDWHKTNLTTIDNGREPMHDTARCNVCGITGKRYGVSDVTRDRAFKAAGFSTCNGAQKLLARRRAQ